MAQAIHKDEITYSAVPPYLTTYPSSALGACCVQAYVSQVGW